MQIFANNDNTELKDIPANLEIPIKSCISQLLKSKQDESSIISKYTNSNATCLALDYQLKVSEYYEIKDKPVFPIAYAAIASAKDFTMFDTLLKLESKYSSSVSSLINDHKNQSDQVKFNHEMQLDQFNSQETSPEIITLLLQNQLEEFEALEMKQLAQLNNLYESQKIEYRDFVVKLYTELKDRAVADPAASLKRSSFVDVANTSQDLLIPKVVPKLLKSPSLEMLSVIDSTDSKNEVKTDPKILQIQELGFSDIDAEAALDMKRNDLVFPKLI